MERLPIRKKHGKPTRIALLPALALFFIIGWAVSQMGELRQMHKQILKNNRLKKEEIRLQSRLWGI